MRDLIARLAMAGVVPTTIVGVNVWRGVPLELAALAPLGWCSLMLAAVLVLRAPVPSAKPDAAEPARFRKAA